MSERKKITIVRAGGVSSVEVDIFPGDTVEQLITLVAPQLGFSSEGNYQLLGPDNIPIVKDLYKVIKDGDELTLAPIGVGG